MHLRTGSTAGNRFRIAAILVAAATTASAQAGDIFVSPAGDDSASGSSAGDAYASLQAALDAARPGDVIRIAAGTYVGGAATRTDASGGLIRIVAESGAVLTNPGGTALQIAHGGYALENVSFGASNTQLAWSGRGGSVVGGVFSGASGNAVHITGGEVTITGSRVENASGAGIAVGGAANARVVDTTVVDAGRGGIVQDAAGSRLTVLGTTVRGSLGTGLDVRAGEAFVRGTVLAGNRAGGLNADAGSDVVALNNTIDGNGEVGVRVAANTATLINNAITSSLVGLRASPSSAVSSRNNLYFGNLADAVGTGTGDEALFINPEYVNPGEFDYRLGATSGAIDRGYDVSSLYGPTATTGDGYDIGANEYTDLPGGGVVTGTQVAVGQGGTFTTSAASPSPLAVAGLDQSNQSAALFIGPTGPTSASLAPPPLIDGGGGEPAPPAVPAPSTLMTVAGTAAILLRRRR